MSRVFSFSGGAFSQNTVLVVCEDKRTGVLVDPGAETRTALLKAEGEGVEIEAIFLTHAHLDHVEGVAAARAKTGAEIFLHPADRVLYEGAASQAEAFGIPFSGPLPAPDKELAHGMRLRWGGTEFEVLEAPGHSPGHVILSCPKEGFAVVGDVIFQGSIGRTDLPGGNFQTLIDSIRRRVLTLAPDVRLFPGHGPATTVGHEARFNPFLVPSHSGEMA